MRKLALLLLLVGFVVGCTPKADPVPEGDSTVTTSETNMTDTPVTEPTGEHGPDDGHGHESNGEAPVEESKDTAPGAATEMKPAAYTNAKGEIVCPVMGAVTTEKDAVGYQDYEGVRYYFCCGDCPAAFKKDPTRWIKE